MTRQLHLRRLYFISTAVENTKVDFLMCKRVGIRKRQFAENFFLFSAVDRFGLQAHPVWSVAVTGLITSFLLALEFERYKNSLLCFGKRTAMNM